VKKGRLATVLWQTLPTNQICIITRSKAHGRPCLSDAMSWAMKEDSLTAIFPFWESVMYTGWCVAKDLRDVG
jgi:hypothetical protein